MKLEMYSMPFDVEDREVVCVVVRARGIEAPEISPVREWFFSATDRLLGMVGVEVVLRLSDTEGRMTVMFPASEGWVEDDALEAVYQNLDSELADYLD